VLLRIVTIAAAFGPAFDGTYVVFQILMEMCFEGLYAEAEYWGSSTAVLDEAFAIDYNVFFKFYWNGDRLRFYYMSLHV